MNSGFKAYHPAVNLLFFAGVVVFGMMFLHPLCLVVSFLSAAGFNIALKGKKALKELLYLCPMIAVVTVINALFSHYGVTVLAELPSGNNLTLESIIYGFITGVMLVSVILWFNCYSEVVTADKLMFVIGRRIPAVALIISMALRFVPLYRQRLAEISEAQKGLGKDSHSGKLTERIKNAASQVSILITWSLENAVETSGSMRSRGYGLKGRKPYSRYRMKSSDWTAVAVLAVTYAIIIYAAASGTLKCTYNPYILIPAFTPSAIVTLAAYSVMCLFPLLIDLKEGIKWNRLKSKI